MTRPQKEEIMKKSKRYASVLEKVEKNKLYSVEEAVKLALTVDLELAKYCADKAEDDETKKKLWLLIARYLIEVCFY